MFNYYGLQCLSIHTLNLPHTFTAYVTIKKNRLAFTNKLEEHRQYKPLVYEFGSVHGAAASMLIDSQFESMYPCLGAAFSCDLNPY